MDIGVEISLYPLIAESRPCIHDLIQRLDARGRFRIESNSMSTQVFGRYEDVLSVLQEELRVTFEQLEARGEKAVLVMKMMGPLKSV